MKDILGRELSKGDIVFIINNDSLLLAKVNGFTNCYVVLLLPPSGGFTFENEKKVSNKLMIATQEEARLWIEESYPEFLTQHAIESREKKKGYLSWLN